MPLRGKAFSSAAPVPPPPLLPAARPALSLVLGETGTLKIPPRKVPWFPACSVATAVDLKCLPGSPSSAQQTAAFAYSFVY